MRGTGWQTSLSTFTSAPPFGAIQGDDQTARIERKSISGAFGPVISRNSPSPRQDLMPKHHPHSSPRQHPRKHQRIRQILPSIAPRLTQRDLRASDRYGLAGVGKEVRQDGSGVCERVGTGEDDEA